MPDASLSYLSVRENRSTAIAELRRRLPGMATLRASIPFGVAALDSYLPAGGLAAGALHEVVPTGEAATPAALGFIAAFLAGLSSPLPEERRPANPTRRHSFVFVLPTHERRRFGRLHGHGLHSLGLDPARLLLTETKNRKDTLWAMEESLRSGAPAAVIGMIDSLDLKLSQRLQLAAVDAGLPLLLLRPRQNLEASAAATRWRVGTAEAARDRFGLFTRPRWRLHLERCRNGRPGQWMAEYDHVTHRFSLVAALADSAPARSASEKPLQQAC